MKRSLVLRSVFNRTVKKLKKEKSLPHHQALDEAAKVHGFANHKHYKNTLGTARNPPQISKPTSFERVAAEIDFSEKIELARSFLRTEKPAFNVFIEILKLFRGFPDSDLAVQMICDDSGLRKDIQTFLLNDYQEGEAADEIEMHFVAKALTVSSLRYRLQGSKLLVQGSQCLEVEFGQDVPKEQIRFPHWYRPPAYGNFAIIIGKGKDFSIEYSDVDPDHGDESYLSKFVEDWQEKMGAF